MTAAMVVPFWVKVTIAPLPLNAGPMAPKMVKVDLAAVEVKMGTVTALPSTVVFFAEFWSVVVVTSKPIAPHEAAIKSRLTVSIRSGVRQLGVCSMVIFLVGGRPVQPSLGRSLTAVRWSFYPTIQSRDTERVRGPGSLAEAGLPHALEHFFW